jgi:hypothetical protein
MTETQKTEMLGNFLALCEPNKLDKCAGALEVLMAAVEGAPLYNVDYKDAKYWLDRAAEAAWDRDVFKAFVAGQGGDSADADFTWYLGSVHGLHQVPSRVKKLNKMKPETNLSDYSNRTFAEVSPEMVEAARDTLDALLPVALMVKELKGSVVKGRKPSKPSAAKKKALAKEAAKRTCPCCFRAMAMNMKRGGYGAADPKKGSIVRHGWQEAGGRRVGEYGNTWHLGECFGVGYEPYEVSDLGTRKFLEYLETRVLPQEEEALENLKARPAKLHYSKRVLEDGRWQDKMVEVEDDGQPLESGKGAYSVNGRTYCNVLVERIYNQEQTLKMLRRDMDTLRTAIADWKKVA